MVFTSIKESINLMRWCLSPLLTSIDDVDLHCWLMCSTAGVSCLGEWWCEAVVGGVLSGILDCHKDGVLRPDVDRPNTGVDLPHIDVDLPCIGVDLP